MGHEPLTVTIKQPSALTVTVKQPSSVTANTKVFSIANVNLEKLKNVTTIPFGLNDNFVVVYDTTSKQWIAQALPEGITGDIDGGAY